MNSAIEDLINEWAGHIGVLDSLMKLAASDLIYLVIPLGLLLWFLPGAATERALRQRVWIAAVISALVALAIGSLVAHLHSDARPFVSRPDTHLLISHSADNGFPSDHATVAFAVAVTLVWWRRYVGLVAIAAACLVAFARVFVGVHWPSDVLAGAAIGGLTGTLAARTVPLWAWLQARAAALLPAWLVSAPHPVTGDVTASRSP